MVDVLQVQSTITRMHVPAELTPSFEADLLVGAEYGTFDASGNTSSELSDEPISALLPVGNQGGIRYSGGREITRVVVLHMAAQHEEWPDSVDRTTAKVTYYGDARKERSDHTQTRGNKLLEVAFRNAATPQTRSAAPVFLVFRSSIVRRNVVFEGVAAPGHPATPAEEALTAVWADQSLRGAPNYKTIYTLLDIPVVSRTWLNHLLVGGVSTLCNDTPESWARWVRGDGYTALLR